MGRGRERERKSERRVERENNMHSGFLFSWLHGHGVDCKMDHPAVRFPIAFYIKNRAEFLSKQIP